MREITVPGCNARARRKFLTLTVLCVMFTALGGCSAQQVANAPPEKGDATSGVPSTGVSAPQAANVDQFLESLREIAEHGDLADARYYGEKLGITMRESASGRIIVPRMCGLAINVHYREISGQLFYYSSVPDFFDKTFVMRDCQEPYTKEFLQDGKIRIDARMDLNAEKICIRPEDVRRYFTMDDKYIGGSYLMRSVSQKEGEVRVGVFVQRSEKCVSIVDLQQTCEKRN